MGAFHDGHLSLMRAARPSCDTLITSLFVNPTQFGPNEDYTRYPRNEEQDAGMAQAAGVDVLFAPDVETMYPEKPVSIHVPGVTERWEGAIRPGHFDGVATVVCKLFNITKADIAYFGQKDYQQCAVIAKMVKDLNLDISLSFEPTVREASGLAMSSRNQYLSEAEETKAPIIYEVLCQASDTFSRTYPCNQTVIDSTLANAVSRLESEGFQVDYFALVDRYTLEPLELLDQEARLIVAARLGKVRLIDNIRVL
jgi:pantoate--beta-alanine ligase